MELLNNILSTMMGRHFTLDTMSTTADALGYMYTLKKAVEDEIRGNGKFYIRFEYLEKATVW